MAFVVKDRVKETSTSTGTGTFALTGLVSGFQSFSAALANGDTTYYAIIHSSTGAFEVGIGTYNSGSLTRDTILESSNSDSVVDFQSGTKEVFITYPAGKAVFLDSSDNISIPGIVNLNRLDIASIGHFRAAETTSSSIGSFDVALFTASKYRSLKLVIQATNQTDTTYYVSELLCFHDGSEAYSTEYATMHTSPEPDFTVVPVLNNGNFVIRVTTLTADTINYKFVIQATAV